LARDRQLCGTPEDLAVSPVKTRFKGAVSHSSGHEHMFAYVYTGVKGISALVAP